MKLNPPAPAQPPPAPWAVRVHACFLPDGHTPEALLQHSAFLRFLIAAQQTAQAADAQASQGPIPSATDP